MIHPLFEGIIIGLTMAVMLGPALFALLQTSIHRGTKAGVILAFGIFLSDFFISGIGVLADISPVAVLGTVIILGSKFPVCQQCSDLLHIEPTANQ